LGFVAGHDAFSLPKEIAKGMPEIFLQPQR
jgi:hypothetical protein